MGKGKKVLLPRQATLDFERKPHGNNYLFCEKIIDHSIQRLPAWRSLKIDGAAVDSLGTACKSHNIPDLISALGFRAAPSLSPNAQNLFLPDEKDPAALLMASERDIAPSAPLLMDAMRLNGTRWGILTNATNWRLCSLEAFPPLEHYYEADLPHLLGIGGDELKFFLMFFSAHAFKQFEKHGSFVEAVMSLTRKAVRDLVAALSDAASNAACELCRGFIRQEKDATGATPAGPGLDMVYRHSLVILYRIFYILIAEARGALPGNNAAYWPESLTKFASETTDPKTIVPQNFPATYSAWPRLEHAFERIYKGDAALDIIPQTCEFFSPARHPFLLRNRIDDRHFQLAFQHIMGALRGISAGLVDMHAIHVAEIFSRLPELQLNIAEEPMLRILDEGRICCLPAKGVKWKKIIERINTGEAYLEKAAGLAVERERPGLDAVRGFVENSLAISAINIFDKKTSAGISPKNASIFDPVCGTGETLVCAADFLARRAASADPTHPFQDFKRLSVDNSLYGADPNPLMAELARFVITLYAASDGLPPPALDHRIQAGNTILGARISDLESSPITNMDALLIMTKERMKELAAAAPAPHYVLPSKKYGEAYRRETSATRLLKRISEIRTAADLWVESKRAPRTAVAQIESAIAELASSAKFQLKKPAAVAASPALDTSTPLHPEWAFPVIFFSAAGAGFDAIITVLPTVFSLEAKSRAFVTKRLGLKGHFVFADAFSRSIAYCAGNKGLFSLMVPQRFAGGARAKSMVDYLLSEIGMKKENTSELRWKASGKRFTAICLTKK